MVSIMPGYLMLGLIIHYSFVLKIFFEQNEVLNKIEGIHYINSCALLQPLTIRFLSKFHLIGNGNLLSLI
jgi:hypothetical protein